MICVNDPSALTVEYMETKLRRVTPDIEISGDNVLWRIRYGAPRLDMNEDEDDWGAVFRAESLRAVLEAAYHGRFS